MKKIPYAISGYDEIRQQDYYFVDKTPYIPMLEDMGKYLIFIRPRRFGKSSLLTMLESYYDIACAEKFDALFGGTSIYDHPTPEKHRYLIMHVDFSAVTPTPEAVEHSFIGHIQNHIKAFRTKYCNLLDKDFVQDLESITNVYQQLEFLTKFVGMVGHKMYVLIDEYDNFANTILAKHGQTAYQTITRGDGFLRHFFAILKSGAGQNASGIARIFITGVSPITLDDVTSGFNIGRNISLSPKLNELLGFTTTDVQTMLEYYHQQGVVSDDLLTTILPQLQTWYDGYRFSKHCSITLFNPTLVLYCLKEIHELGMVPDTMIDQSIRIDYEKLRHLVVLDNQLNGNFRQLTTILANQETPVIDVVESFPVDRITKPSNFLSLLYYFGLLTYTDHNTLHIPNETVKQMFYGYIRDGLEDTKVFTIELMDFSALMQRMAYDGEWRPLFAFLATEVERQTKVRDYLSGEKVIQTFLRVYLNMVNYYHTHTEQEMKKGFADIYLEPNWERYADIRYSYLIELKYIPRTEYSDERMQAELVAAKAQVQHYATDDMLVQRNRGETLCPIVLVFRGWELMAMESV